MLGASDTSKSLVIGLSLGDCITARLCWRVKGLRVEIFGALSENTTRPFTRKQTFIFGDDLMDWEFALDVVSAFLLLALIFLLTFFILTRPIVLDFFKSIDLNGGDRMCNLLDEIKKDKKNQKVMISVRVDPEELEQLDAICKANNLTRSVVLQSLITDLVSSADDISV